MAHLVNQQLQQTKQQYDEELRPGAPAGQSHVLLHHQGHSLELPAILHTSQPHAYDAAAVSRMLAGTATAGAAAAAAKAALLTSRQAPDHPDRYGNVPQQQQQHSLQASDLVAVSGPAATSKAHSALQLLQHGNSRSATAKPDASASGLASQPSLQQDLKEHKAANQVPHHSRGLLVAGAYVLQPLRTADGDPRQRSSSPDDHPWLQQVNAMGGPTVQAAAAAVPEERMPQQQQHRALGLQHTSKQNAAAVAAHELPAATPQDPAAAAHCLLTQHHQMLLEQQQQQQQCQKPQPARHVRQQVSARLETQPPQSHQRSRSSRQHEQHTAVDMDLEDAARALDMLSEIAAAAAAAEEMNAGVPSPMHPGVLNVQALAAAPISFARGSTVHRTRVLHEGRRVQAVGRISDPSANSTESAAATNAAAAAAATQIPAAAAAAIAAAAAAQHSRHTQGMDAAGYILSSAQAKRPRGSSGGAAVGVGSSGQVYPGTKTVKKTRSGDWAGVAAGAQQRHSHDGSVASGSTSGAGWGLHPRDLTLEAPGLLSKTGSSVAAAAETSGHKNSAPAAPAAIRAAVAELAALAAAATAPKAGGPVTAPLPHSQQPTLTVPTAQLGGRLPIAFMVRGLAASGNPAYLMYPAGAYAAQQRPQANAVSLRLAAAVHSATAAAAAHSSQVDATVKVSRRLVQKPAVKAVPVATHPGSSSVAHDAEETDAAAHDLAIFAAAAAADAAATKPQFHTRASPAAAAPAHAAASSRPSVGRSQRKSAATAASFIAAVAAATDDGPACGGDNKAFISDEDDSDREAAHHAAAVKAHKRCQERLQHSEPPFLSLDHLASAAASDPASAADSAPAALAHALAAPAATGSVRVSTGSARSRGGSDSGSMYGHDYDTDEADGGAYVCEEQGEQQDSDDDGSEGRRSQGMHRSTKERVLSNRLAASRSYQRRKEDMLRLEYTHARLQMEKQAVAHALQETEAELQVHRDIATSFAGLQQPSMYGKAAGPPRNDAAVIARHNAMHNVLLQRVQSAFKHQQRKRQVHADMVEEAALAAAAAADGLGIDGAGSYGPAGSY